MTWPLLLQLLHDGEEALPLRAFAEEMRSYCGRYGPAQPDLPVSRVVLGSLAGFPGPEESTQPPSGSSFPLAQLTEAQASLRTNTAVVLLRSFVTHIHRKSPKFLTDAA